MPKKDDFIIPWKSFQAWVSKVAQAVFVKVSNVLEFPYRLVVLWGAGSAMADQVTLSQPGGGDNAHHITTGTPGFSDLRTALLPKVFLF